MQKARTLLQVASLGALLALFLMVPEPAPAYLTKLAGGNLVRWQAGSPATIWNDATKTLTWHYNSINFPKANWPATRAAIGAAFQNSFQTIADVPSTSIKFNRGSDVSSTPLTDDGRSDMVLAPDETNDYWNQDISGAFAVTKWSWNPATGVYMDADIEMNGDPSSFTWATTGPPVPPGSNDIELTACHEHLHGIGLGHTVYFYGMIWPTGRFPEVMMQDRCLSPDDRVGVRTLYPGATALSTISGTVTVAAGGNCNLAVIVATDGNGIPQCTQTTAANGTYSINVPPGTNYTVTAHHRVNSTYNSDINFGGATGFITSGQVTGVNASASIAGVNFTVTGGVPTFKLTGLGLGIAGALDTQTLFLTKNSTNTARFEVSGTAIATLLAGSTSMGPGITVNTATVAPGIPGTSVVSVNYTVAVGATAGVRNVTFATGSAGNERVFLPSLIEVLDTGALAVAASAGNPVAGASPLGTVDRPLLGFTLAANGVEDVRIRQLRFDIGGAGTTLPAVRLWIDRGTIGTVDGADTRIFSGAAYAATPVAEILPGLSPGTVAFNDIAVSIPVGTTVTFLLTADMPATGSGSYVASLNSAVAANITSHGMYYGDVIVPTGGTITGGAQSTGPLGIGGLAQIRTTATTVIPVGGSTTETQVTLRGVPTSSVGLVGMDVEVKPLAQAFTDVPNGTAAATQASGTTINITVGALTDLTSYHWQARPVSSTTGAGAWTSFGANAETAIDFSVDTSTTNIPSGLAQFESDGITSLPLGGATRSSVVLTAINGTNTGGSQVRLEVEVQPVGTPFTDTPNRFGALVASGAAGSVTFAGATNDYHWQARTTSAFGASSAWVDFNAAALHFHLDAIVEIKADAGCIGRVSTGGDGWAVWASAGLALLLLTVRRRGAQRVAGTLALVLCLGAAAQADDGGRLPLSLADSVESAPAPALEPEPEPAMAPSRAWFSADAYLGFLFMDMKFDAVGTDFIRRRVNGTGSVVLGVEGFFHVHPDWRVGLAAEVDYWSDVRVLAVGPVGMWRFHASHTNIDSGIPDSEHFLKVALIYEKLTVTKQDFGSFKSSFGIRAGYEARIAVGSTWAILLGAEVQYSKWDYSPAVNSGDTSVGGLGGLLSFGIVLQP